MKRCEKATWNKPAGRYRKLIVSLLYSSSLNWNPSSSLHLFIIIRFFPPFVKTIDLENVPKKKEEVTRSQPRENLFFLCSGCQPSSGRLRAPRAPHRFAPTGVFPPVIFRVHGPRLHHNGGHKAQITGPRVDCCFCFLPLVSDKIRSWGSLSLSAGCFHSEENVPATEDQGGLARGSTRKCRILSGPRLNQQVDQAQAENVAAEKCRFSLPFLEEKKLSSRRFFPDILKNELWYLVSLLLSLSLQRQECFSGMSTAFYVRAILFTLIASSFDLFEGSWLFIELLLDQTDQLTRIRIWNVFQLSSWRHRTRDVTSGSN